MSTTAVDPAAAEQWEVIFGGGALGTRVYHAILEHKRRKRAKFDIYAARAHSDRWLEYWRGRRPKPPVPSKRLRDTGSVAELQALDELIISEVNQHMRELRAGVEAWEESSPNAEIADRDTDSVIAELN